MDLAALISAKRFLGQEFLAWLWFKSDTSGGALSTVTFGEVELSFMHHMQMEAGEGEFQEKVTCRGLKSQLQEARAGLFLGKKPEQVRMKVVIEGREWYCTLSGGLFEFRNVKIPKNLSLMDGAMDRSAAEGDMLLRLDALEEISRLVNELFALFLRVRTSGDWDKEIRAIRDWITKPS